MHIAGNREELQSRHRAYERERSLVLGAGFAPLLFIYLMVHTRYLRPYVSESKSIALLELLILPAAWFAGMLLLYTWFGPIRHRLRCPRCAHRLVGTAITAALETGSCANCGARLVSQPTV